jgi:hypothetical protein
MPPDLSALAAALADRLAEAERCQVNKLDALFSIMDAASRAASREEQERIIRTHVREYFDADADAQAQPPPALVRPWSPCPLPAAHSRTDDAGAHLPPAQVKQSSQYLVADIRSLLRQGKKSLTTSRSVARVLHGLTSSQVTAEVWRQNPSWGKHAAVDFQAVMRACDAEMNAQV